MEKINLREVRGFSDSITVSFNFLKQEFVPLIKAFAVIVLPLIFVDLFFRSYVMRSTLNMAINPDMLASSPGQYMLNILVANLAAIVAHMWMSFFGIAYLRAYILKYDQGNQERITMGDVWRVMSENMGKLILWGIIYLLMGMVGCMCCVVPGIYLAVAYFFTAYFMVLEGKTLSGGMSESLKLIKGNWWSLFGFLALVGLIVGMLSYVFGIPSMILTFKSMLTQELPGVYETTFGLFFASLGQTFLQVILIIGGGVRFFSFLEQREHTGLIQKINQIGETV